MNRRNESAVAYGMLILVFLLWGSLYVVSTQVLAELSAYTVLFLRFLIAWLFLTELCAVKKEKPKKIEGKDRKYLYCLALVGYTAAVGIQLIGTKLVGSTASSLINSMNPVAISVFAVIFLKEKMTVNKVIGIILTIAGAFVIIGGTAIDPMKSAVSIGSVLLWSFTSVMTRKGLSGYDPIYVTRKAIGAAAFFSFFFAAAEICMTGAPLSLSAGCILRLLYMSVCCTAIPYIFWNYALSKLPAANCSAFYPLQPLCAAALGILVFHEQVQSAFWMGSLLIVGGILITLLLTPKTVKVCERTKREALLSLLWPDLGAGDVDRYIAFFS